MNPSEKGWFTKFLQLSPNMEQRKKLLEQIEDNEQYVYAVSQPTGLMYGYPTKLPEISLKNIDEWDSKEKMKILLSHGFRNCIFLKNKELVTETELAIQINTFYKIIQPELVEHTKKEYFFFSSERTNSELSEDILNKRVHVENHWDNSFWSSFFHNSLLFLDIVFFNKWVSDPSDENLKLLKDEKEKLCFEIIKIIACAAHSNNVIEKEEEILFNYFLHSANLSPEKEEEARTFLHKAVSLEDIDWDIFQSWIVQKYVLELAILTIWSDKIVTEEEKDFLIELYPKLNLSEEDFENSMLAIETFVMENWKDVHYLQTNANYALVSKKVYNKMSVIMGGYKKRIKQEISESKELVQLLAKSQKTELTEEEKEKVRIQLMDILKTLPVFVIIALPGSFLTLPILLKLLPKSALPSSFQD